MFHVQLQTYNVTFLDITCKFISYIIQINGFYNIVLTAKRTTVHERIRPSVLRL
jgi:hypothetical protein